MAELIDKDELLKKSVTIPGPSGKSVYSVVFIDDILNAKPIEPKIGHWIKSNIPNEEYICSECGGACWYYDYQGDIAKSKYCPNCGADMREVVEDKK